MYIKHVYSCRHFCWDIFYGLRSSLGLHSNSLFSACWLIKYPAQLHFCNYISMLRQSALFDLLSIFSFCPPSLYPRLFSPWFPVCCLQFPFHLGVQVSDFYNIAGKRIDYAFLFDMFNFDIKLFSVLTVIFVNL